MQRQCHHTGTGQAFNGPCSRGFSRLRPRSDTVDTGAGHDIS